MNRVAAAVTRRRLVRGVGRGLLLLAALIFVVAASLLLAPVRGRLLGAVLARVDASLPGDLAWERAAWPGFGRLELDGLRWTVDGDTLLEADGLRLEVALRPLLARDVEVRELALRGLRVDVPALQDALPASAPADTAAAPASFPRSGSLPGLPSLAVARARLDVARVDLGEGRVVRDALVRAAVELRVGHDPHLTLDTLRVAAAPGGWSVPEGALAVRPGATSGRVRAVSAAGDSVALDVVRAESDSFTVVLHASGAAAADLRGRGVLGVRPLRAGLQLSGRVAGQELRGLDLALAERDDPAAPLRASLRVAVPGWTIAAAGDVARGDSLVVDLEPVVVRADTSTAAPPAGGPAGRVVAKGGEVRWHDVRLAGDLGAWRLAGSRAGDRIALTAAADLPGPARLLRDRPELRVDDWTSLAADIHARVTLGGATPAWTAVVDLDRTPWLERGRLRVHGEGPDAVIDDLALDLPGLAATAGGAASPQALDLRVRLDLTDAATLRRFAEIPGDLVPTAQADLHLTGSPQAPRLDVSTRARVGTEAWDVGLAVAASIIPGDSLVVTTAPLAVVEGREPPAPPAGPRTGRAVLHGRDWSLRGVQVTGDPGDLRLDGAGGDAGIDLTLAADWPAPPPALLRRLADLEIAWTGAGARAAVHLEPDAPGGPPARGRVTASLDLPGPAALAALAPDVRLDDLATLNADVEADLDLAADAPGWRADVDLARTPWLDAGRIKAHGRGPETVLETLVLALPGLAVSAAGRVDADSLALDGVVTAPDASLLARLPAVPAWSDFELRLDLAARGAVRAPRLQGGLEARVAAAAFGAPRLTGAFLAAADTFAADLQATDGLTIGLLAFDRVRLSSSSSDPAAGLVIALDAEGDALAVALAGGLTRAPAPALELDALRLVSDGRDLSLTRPFRAERRGEGWTASSLELAGGLGRLRGGGSAAPDSLAIALDADLHLPLSLVRTLAPGLTLPADRSLEDLVLSGDVVLGGTPAAPRLGGRVGAAVRGGTGPADLALAADLDAVPGRLSAALRLERRGRLLAAGDADLPAVFSLNPPSFAPSATDSFHAALRTEPLDLADLADYLPPDLRVAGPFAASVDLRGVGRLAALRGFVAAPRLRLALSDGSWLTLGGRMDLGGTSERPSLRGRLTVTGGVVIIPDVPQPLLPASGPALLLERPVGAAPADSVIASAPAVAPPVDLDLRVVCPGDLWLRGRGLSLQLAGDLRATVLDREPAVVGELRTVEGTYRFLGTLFNVERGVVSFYGDLEADPRLDLELTSQAGGTVFRIAMQGWALAPELRLSSEPEMTEGDIVASLLFGKPLDQLDSGQESLLKARTAQVLTSLGATRVSDRLSRALGADLVAYNQSQDSGAGSLMLGKYLSPRLLLKYEQFLDRRTSYYVRLDYALSRFFRLETSVGQGEESGVELKWARDY